MSALVPLLYANDPADFVTSGLHPDFEYVEHRSLSYPNSDLEGLVDIVRTRDFELQIVVPAIHRLSERACVWQRVETSVDEAEVIGEHHVIVVSEFGDELVRRVDVYELDDVDAALARFHQIENGRATAGTFTNQTWVACRAAVQAHTDGDRDRFAAFLSDDFVAVTFDPVMREISPDGHLDRELYLDAIFDPLVSGPGFRLDAELIAVRDDDLCLSRVIMTTPDNAVVERLQLVEGRDGLAVRIDHFTHDQLREAQQALDRRWLAARGYPLEHPFFNLLEPCYEPAAATMADMVNPGFDFVEHRVLSFPGGDVDQLVTNSGTAFLDSQIIVPRYLALSDRGSLLHRIERTLDGFAEDHSLALTLVGDNGRIDHFEVFDVAEEAAALARYEELVAPERTPSSIANLASHVSGEAIRLAARDGMAAHQHRFSPAFVMENRRKRSLPYSEELTEAADSIQWLIELGTLEIAVDDIAVRDEMWCLQQWNITMANGDELQQLVLGKVDPEGRIEVGISYDLDQLTEALVELDQRWLDSLGFASDHVARRMVVSAYTTDAEVASATWHPELEFRNHRKLAYQSGDAAALGEVITSQFFEMVITIPRYHRICDDGAVLERVETAVDELGENRMIIVISLRDELIDHLEAYDTDDLDAALARFDELTSRSQRRELSNSAWNVVSEMRAAFHDLDGVEARITAVLHRDFVHETLRWSDRRAEDRETFISNNTPPPDSVTQRAIAIRGEQLVLTRDVIRTGDDEIVFHGLYETLDGQILRFTTFDEHALVDAQRTLDQRWFDALGFSDDHFLRRISDAGYSMDPELTAGTLHPDVEYVEHRPLGFTSGDRDSMVTNMRTASHAAVVSIPVVYRTNERGLAFLRVESAIDEVAENHMIVVSTFQDELTRHIELYDETDLDAALARYDELTAAEAAADQTSLPTNTAWQLTEEHFGILGGDASDSGVAWSRFHDDFRATPAERLSTGAPDFGAAKLIEFVSDFLRSAPLTSASHVPVAVRGDHLCIGRSEYWFEDDLIVRYNLLEYRDHLLYRATFYDDTQLTEAQRELDRRYLESLGYGADHFLQRILPVAYSLDPGAMADVLHPDLEYIEHRPLTFEGGDRTRVISNMASIDFDAHVVIPTIHRISERAAVWEKREVADSGAGETAMIIVATFDNELCRALEMFEPDHLDAALTRYDDLAISSESS